MRPDQHINTARTDPEYLPDWVPQNARHYIDHTGKGLSIRALARQNGHHASTILRQVRQIETRRDDPLVDEALCLLETEAAPAKAAAAQGNPVMQSQAAPAKIAKTHEIESEARRILRRMCEATAFMVVAPAMEKAAIMRETSPGRPTRIAVVDRHIAQAFALHDWIECTRKGKIMLYHITTAGKAALKRLLAANPPAAAGFAEAATPFLEQHKIWDERVISQKDARPRKMRCNLAESPITALGRRKGQDGAPFLSAALIQAGERLREDFEMAQMGARVTQNWDRFLSCGRTGGGQAGANPSEGPTRARERVAAALGDLGPGLGDIALRCCCYLEGMETAEKRMGWSARSGKIVLRIALTRLKLHYEQKHGTLTAMIG